MRKSWLLSIVLLTTLSGCHRYLVDTPNLLQNQDPHQVYANCPKDCQTADAAILYATDRTVVMSSGHSLAYSYGRATRLAFGEANVSLNPQPSWKELLEASTQVKRGREYELKLASINEAGRFRSNVAQMLINSEGQQIVQATAKEEREAVDQFRELLRSRLAQSAQKDVYIFVHGFNNTFEDSIFAVAEVWHFLGRTGVPIAYSWPAGRGGIRGYAYDRESGEYTVSHLRRFLKGVADCPEVERVHLIAHSRGCEVAMSALREFHLSVTAQGKSTQQELRLENLVLAAPDVDEQVFLERFVGENLLQLARRTTIYTSPRDRAIELSDLIFASRNRLGSLAVKDFSPKVKHTLAKLPNVQFIECKLTGMWIGHGYVFTNPAALSDLILVLRDRRPPGAENGRPLRPVDGIWELTDDYLARVK